MFLGPQGRNSDPSWIAFFRWRAAACTQGATALSTTDVSSKTADAWLSDLHSVDGLAAALTSGETFATTRGPFAPLATFFVSDELPSGACPLAP